MAVVLREFDANNTASGIIGGEREATSLSCIEFKCADSLFTFVGTVVLQLVVAATSPQHQSPIFPAAHSIVLCRTVVCVTAATYDGKEECPEIRPLDTCVVTISPMVSSCVSSDIKRDASCLGR